MTRRQEISEAISDARKAQLEAQGGYAKVEADAKGHDRYIRRLRPLPPTIQPAERRTRRKLTDVQLAEVRAMYAAGVSLRRIAVQFGVSKTTIDYWLYPACHKRELDRHRRPA